MLPSSSSEKSTKTRKRALGEYLCEFEGCGKVFSRSDRLSRHRANHVKGKQLLCGVAGCKKSFVRRDVRNTHRKLHTSKELEEFELRTEAEQVVEPRSDDAVEKAMTPKCTNNISVGRELALFENYTPNITQDIQFHTSNVLRRKATSNPYSIIPQSEQSPPGFIKWLLQDNTNQNSPEMNPPLHMEESGAFADNFDINLLTRDYEGSINTESFDNMPTSNRQSELLNLGFLLELIPSLSQNPDFTVHKCDWFITVYWELFHPQYPVLHHASFSAKKSHPLLILTMIMIGSSMCNMIPLPENFTDPLNNSSELSNQIAEPLFWLLLSSDQAKPPCKPWFIHCLLTLEIFCMNRTSSELFERACIYSSTKIQLLRRSSFLMKDSEQSNNQDVENLLDQWIERESMKRVAWATFYTDTVHAIVYTQPVSLYANQIKMSLPCPDELWEADSFDLDYASKSIMSISNALRAVLQQKPIQGGYFVQRIILGAILNLILQMELRNSQTSMLGISSENDDDWKSTISSTLGFWVSQSSKGCRSSFNGMKTLEGIFNNQISRDNQCWFPEFHIAQLYLRLSQYEILVYAGTPRRANVKIFKEDYDRISKRITKWALTESATICVTHCLIFLFELILPPEDQNSRVNFMEYQPDFDSMFYRPKEVAMASLCIWAFIFNQFGAESNFKATNSKYHSDSDISPVMEDASSYLNRVRNDLSTIVGMKFKSVYEPNEDGSDYETNILKFAQALRSVKNLNHISGLLIMLSKGFLNCQWDPGADYGQILKHCALRSSGLEDIFCQAVLDRY